MEFKDRLRMAIENKGVTPYAIGRDTKVSKVSVGNYLNGAKPNIDNLSILSDYLGVSLQWLMTGEEISFNDAIIGKEGENNTSSINADGDLKTDIEMERKIKRLEASIDALIEKNERLEAELAEYKAKEVLSKGIA